MKQMRRIAVAVLLLTAFAGCKGPESGLTVDVRAEAKKGYEAPSVATYGGSANSDDEGHDHRYHLIDYANLRDVVVWAEPGGGQAVQGAEAKPVEIKLVPAAGTVYATGVGGRIVLRNIGKSSQTVLLRGPAGELAEYQVPASGQAEHAAVKAGLIEVIRDEDEDPIANVYVAPTPLVRVARGGEQVTFSPVVPGKYTVNAWHPILPGSTTTVDVPEGQTAKATLTVGVNALPAPK